MRTTQLAAIALMALVAAAVPGGAAAQATASGSQPNMALLSIPPQTVRDTPPSGVSSSYRHLLWVFYARRGCLPLIERMNCDRADDLVLMFSEVPRLGYWDIDTFRAWIRRAGPGPGETLRSLPGTVMSIRHPEPGL